jgi:hypothetical protein
LEKRIGTALFPRSRRQRDKLHLRPPRGSDDHSSPSRCAEAVLCDARLDAPRIAPQIADFTVYAAIVVAAVSRFDLQPGSYGLAPFTLLGVTLSIYLVFRNNGAYERWWEARKLWGQSVSTFEFVTRGDRSGAGGMR